MSTESGKQTSSQNATSHGLFSSPGNGVFPHELETWSKFTQSFQSELAPGGIVEQTLADEIIHAAWRLRRCNLVESALASNDTPKDTQHDPQLQNSIDRARTSAQRSFHRNIAELRRLQTESQFRVEYFPAACPTEHLGLASTLEVIPILQKTEAFNIAKQVASVFQPLENTTAPPNWVRSAKTPAAPQTSPQPQPQTPRNASCPCGSGNKYKRCCGQNAPGVLGKAA